jgi:hypothetical protein
MIQEIIMDEIFARKVRAAAVAGWWTLLIFYCVLLIQWFAYLLIMARQPAAMLCIWGDGAPFPTTRSYEFLSMYICQNSFRGLNNTVIALSLAVTGLG